MFLSRTGVSYGGQRSGRRRVVPKKDLALTDVADKLSVDVSTRLLYHGDAWKGIGG